VAGTKIHDINPRMGKADDPEKWHDISDAVNKTSVVKITREVILEGEFREVIKTFVLAGKPNLIGRRVRKGRVVGLSVSAQLRSLTPSSGILKWYCRRRRIYT